MSECVSTGSTASYLTVFPLTHSVARELEAMAEPQPNVLNLASTIFPSSSTLIWGGGGGGGRGEDTHHSYQSFSTSDDFETEIDCYLH